MRASEKASLWDAGIGARFEQLDSEMASLTRRQDILAVTIFCLGIATIILFSRGARIA